ncbi:3-hydroxyacyl-CoA dehydrogenase NAD-binding domain-containing protein [Streptomyces caniscabiei]|uniref:3-hydroxyacyl-CoA dehydrogenase NAD-binding domain-containing protein n=1 Tax=Streptomyces caniscabiei TaxID=2746961 RepID=A0ABU4N2E2_9ACTN|nr:3-hydroxyacyl-CoA dehydrogenase NAD-binding domain-containing protein [Streptomyces caniscabiei]MBE4741730.1 enoyl-CoA hydratase/isomerase family protein [Streptomyces caniscabiei]MBE4762408.1 enoyl-CoA hydratase/isomerase family protein [Streptomyces caniscabiei]MBE4775667.1 enoyl-CoA hydratase/isomerase family protein [Streptomyces caniscabiei]MBE4790499.1 enoyl-CoA hydratase/isomerase family protein [Streptomyces caniscabiei]MBE4799778.1 enoyl-CoA hydratase/isomerase family protein [Stre
MSEQDTIHWSRDEDGVVVLTLDAPGQSANTMNAAYVASMGRAVDRLEAERDTITGVVVTSAKKTFFAGGDLHDIMAARSEDARSVLDTATRVKDQLRRLERLGRPVVAAINGSALGGGLEIALACHHRIAADTPGCRIGLPEVTLGLLPGGGGIVRTVRMLGVQDALLKVLLQGQKHRPQAAVAIGLVDEVVDTAAELLPRAKAWLRANPEPVQPWDTKGHRIPGGTPSTPSFAAVLPALPANLRKQLKGAPVPAPRAILSAAVEGAQVDFDTALRIESRYFVELATGQTAKNMIQAFFYDLQHIQSGGSRPDGHAKSVAHKVGVLGAGMMGAGIAHVCALAGLEVVLKDVSAEAAEKGRDHSAGLLAKAVQRGRMTQADADTVLARITATALPSDLTGCDVVIEAVFESQELKHKVFAEIEEIVAPDALLGSNTSTLPITGLAEGVERQADFIGLHFFSPVERMPLLEIIRGERTSGATLARAIDLAGQIGKTPIVVNDSRGFFTSRVIGAFVNEAVSMVGEGLPPASIEQAGAQAGYPAPPLQLVDELSLTLWLKVREETIEALEKEGRDAPVFGADDVVRRMVRDFNRGGRTAGAGFYEYAEGGRLRLWPGLAEHFGSGRHRISFEDMRERMLFAEVLEAVRCFDEGVILSEADANIGSLLGIGFPAWTGGVVQYAKGYPGGVAGFVTRARELADRYGERFLPTPSLVARADASGDRA